MMKREELLNLYHEELRAYRNRAKLQKAYECAEFQARLVSSKIYAAEIELGERYCFECEEWIPLGESCPHND